MKKYIKLTDSKKEFSIGNIIEDNVEEMGLLGRVFGKLKGGKYKPSFEGSGEVERKKSVEGEADRPSKEQYEFKTSLKKEVQQQARLDASRQQAAASSGLERLKTRVGNDEQEIVGDSSKPFFSYAKKKAVPKEGAQVGKKPEMVDLGKVTSKMPSESTEEFTLITSPTFTKSVQSPPPSKSTPPPPASVPPQKPPVLDISPPETPSEQQTIEDSLKDKIIEGMEIPEAAISYHKKRVEFKAEPEPSKQDIESVIERFAPVKEPFGKSGEAGVVEKIQDAAKTDEDEEEQFRISESVLEKPTDKLIEKPAEKPFEKRLEKPAEKPKTGRFIYPPFWKRKKPRPANEVVVKPQFKAAQPHKKGEKLAVKHEPKKIDVKAANQLASQARKGETETKEEIVAPELIFEEPREFTVEPMQFKPAADVTSQVVTVTESIDARRTKQADSMLVDAFSQAFETLLVTGEGVTEIAAESPEGLIEYRPEEVEDLNQMFLQMLSNYLKPLEEGFDTLEKGEYDDETVAGLLGAVRPLRNAALTMRFDKISELLNEIEEPLQIYRLGEIKRFRPTQLASMVLSYRQLFNILPRAKVIGDVRRYSAASELLKLLKTVPEANSECIEKLFACGFSTLEAVRTTIPYEISITCGIPEEIAYKIYIEVVKNMEREV